MTADHVRRNRAAWNATSDSYQEEHTSQLDEKPLAWGVWAIPEAEVGALGDFEGQCMLELGCGAAQWSKFVAEAGGHVVGLDLSEQQLKNALPRLATTGLWIPLVQGSAEELPFADETFDIVFCDHGAMTFCDPHRTLPEAARVLRPDGLMVFNHSSPLRDICHDDKLDRPVETLQRGYFDLERFDEETVCFQLPYGKWLRLFRDTGFEVLDLIELQPREDSTTTYMEFAALSWSRKWPTECLWRLRKK